MLFVSQMRTLELETVKQSLELKLCLWGDQGFIYKSDIVDGVYGAVVGGPEIAEGARPPGSSPLARRDRTNRGSR